MENRYGKKIQFNDIASSEENPQEREINSLNGRKCYHHLCNWAIRKKNVYCLAGLILVYGLAATLTIPADSSLMLILVGVLCWPIAKKGCVSESYIGTT